MTKRPFERALLLYVRRSDSAERFELPMLAELSLEQALMVDLREGPPLDGVIRALQLAAAFDGELESPTVAATIRRVLRNDPHASQLLRTHYAKLRALDEKRAFARREGREVVTRAPKFGERPTLPGVPLKSLLNPVHGGSTPRVIRPTRG